ncbi:DUF6541 family protein [Microbacterium suwonense]|uniref:DUF6541 family protein n=1 Tax=Microbacterium suwonense TaxID=683047 RepID=UPI00360B011A
MGSFLNVWLPFLPPLLVTAAILFLPGFVLGLALRLRGWWLASASAPLSVSLVVVASMVGAWTSIPWTALPLVSLTAVAVAAAWCWMRWIGTPAPARRVSREPRRTLVGIIAVAAGVVTIGLIVLRGMGDPALIAQRYDNFFHINAIQYVLDTANGSPLWVGSMTDPGTLLFYPSAWHAVGALIAQISGCSVPMASNALVVVVAAVVWPLSIILMSRVLFGGGMLVTVAAGALAASSPAFPFLPLHYGPLYPLFLGLAIAPVAIATLVSALRPQRLSRRHDLVLLLVLLVPGVAVAHPGALLAVLALGTPAVVMLGCWLWRHRSGRRERLLIIGGAAGLVVVAMIVLRFLRPPASQIYWPVTGSLPTAIGEVAAAAVYGYAMAYLLAALVLIGVVGALRRRTHARMIALGMGLVGAVLYVVVAGSPFEVLRTWLTGPWYNNAPRLASIWTLAAVPLAASGAALVVRWLMRNMRSSGLRAVTRRIPVTAGVSVLAIGLVVLSQTSAMRQAAADLHYVYGEDGVGPILSAGEYKLLDELDEYVPEDAVIAGDPWTGTSFAYGISGRKVLMPHLLMHETKAARVINETFAQDGDEPEVCQALKKTGVSYILDFDGPDLMPNDGGFDGVTDLKGSPFVELVTSEPGARLYKITTCELGR